jgi:hypothetical protein
MAGLVQLKAGEDALGRGSGIVLHGLDPCIQATMAARLIAASRLLDARLKAGQDVGPPRGSCHGLDQDKPGHDASML